MLILFLILACGTSSFFDNNKKKTFAYIFAQALHADSKVLVPDAEDLESLKPKFIKTLKPLMIKPAGNVAELKCQANGSNLNITWLKVWQLIEEIED